LFQYFDKDIKRLFELQILSELIVLNQWRLAIKSRKHYLAQNEVFLPERFRLPRLDICNILRSGRRES
jgi:hypothetical protein